MTPFMSDGRSFCFYVIFNSLEKGLSIVGQQTNQEFIAFTMLIDDNTTVDEDDKDEDREV